MATWRAPTGPRSPEGLSGSRALHGDLYDGEPWTYANAERNFSRLPSVNLSTATSASLSDARARALSSSSAIVTGVSPEFYGATTYRDAFCTPYPPNDPAVTSSGPLRGNDTFTTSGRYNSSSIAAQRSSTGTIGGTQKFTCGTRSSRQPIARTLGPGEEPLRPPPLGGTRAFDFWTTSDPRYAYRRERGCGGPTVEQLRAIAAETLAICDEGGYQTPSGRAIDIREQIKRAIRSSVLFAPDHAFELRPPPLPRAAEISVTPETICEACTRLIQRDEKVAILNFASPIRPGGGFLNGRLAQEESIARSSALYPTIARHEEFYQAGQARHPLGTDYIIYSPDVPFFRDDNFMLLEEPLLVSILTCAAVEANKCEGRPDLEGKVRETMKNRMRKIISCAAQYGHRILVLGAFGCGVFGNDPRVVAQIEKELLIDEGLIRHFDLVANPIVDTVRAQNFEPFYAVLGGFSTGQQ
jgi:uncharacterized protein (TIGR02452 family)